MSRVEDELKWFAEYVVEQSKGRLAQERKDTGRLHKSIDYQLNVSPRSFSLSFLMEDYGTFIDKGVKGTTSSYRAPNSPYKFGTGTGKKGGLTEGINSWVKRKRFQFREREGKTKGQFLSYAQTAFIIRRAIWHQGLKETNFFTEPFNKAFAKLPQDLIEAYALEMEEFIKFTLK